VRIRFGCGLDSRIYGKCGVPGLYTGVVTPEMWNSCVPLTQVQHSFMLNQKKVIYYSDGHFYMFCVPLKAVVVEYQIFADSLSGPPFLL